VPTLLRDLYFVLERYRAPAFIRLARTAEPLSLHAQAVSSLAACSAALQAVDPSELGILLDWRLAPSMPDADPHEQASVRDAEAFAAPFARRAVLLLTPEISEPAWSDASVQLFYDEEAAIAYVSAR
jgi:hypothetical protein